MNQVQVAQRALRVKEASKAYRIGKTKLYALMNSGALASVKVGGTRLIPVDELERIIAPTPALSDTVSPANLAKPAQL